MYSRRYHSYLLNYIAVSLKERFLLCNNSGARSTCSNGHRHERDGTFQFRVSVIYSRNETFRSTLSPPAKLLRADVRIYRIILERVSSVQ